MNHLPRSPLRHNQQFESYRVVFLQRLASTQGCSVLEHGCIKTVRRKMELPPGTKYTGTGLTMRLQGQSVDHVGPVGEDAFNI